MKSTPKNLTLSNSTTSVTVPLKEVKWDRKGKAKPNHLPEDEGNGKGEQVFIDQGRIEESINFTVKFDDEAARQLDNSESREEVLDKILDIMDSQEETGAEWGTRIFTGMVNQQNITESAKRDSTQYKVKIRILPGADLRDGV